MSGLLSKSWREVRLATLLFGVALMLAEGLFTFILPQIQDEMVEVWLRMPFARTMVTAMLGTDLGDGLTTSMLQAIMWVHPVVLTILWAHEMVLCTRMPAGEIDRGTIDVLLGLPVSRRQVYLCETLMWLATGTVVLLMGMTGYLVGVAIVGIERLGTSQLAPILANMAALYVAVGGLTMLVSSLSDRRGRAIGAVLGIVLASFLLNFLAGFWEPATRISFLSVMDYYRPAQIILTGRVPVGDIAALLGFGAVLWAIGGEVIARRDICTV